MRNSLLLPVLLFMFITGCSTTKTIVDFRQKEAGIITAKEFAPEITEEMEFDERSSIYYKLEHDNENLYLLLAISDNIVQRKIIFFGLTVWTDKTSSRNKNQGFRFPLGSGGNFTGRPVESPADFQILLDRFDEIELIGIYGSSVRKVRTRDSQIRTNISIADDFLIYKAIIPFGLLEHRLNPVGLAKTMSLGIETGHLDLSSSRRRGDSQMPRSGMHPVTGGGIYRPTYPGLPDRNRMEDRHNEIQNLSRPSRLWVELEFRK